MTIEICDDESHNMLRTHTWYRFINMLCHLKIDVMASDANSRLYWHYGNLVHDRKTTND